MSAEDEPRIWAKRDRTIVPPQRRLARAMRAAPTEAERKLWWHLRHRLLRPARTFVARSELAVTSLTLPVTRPHCRRGRWRPARHASAADEARTKVLEANGYRVLRYWNNDVLTNIDGVLEDIRQHNNHDPHPQPLPTRGRGADRACGTFTSNQKENALAGQWQRSGPDAVAIRRPASNAHREMA